MSRRAASDRLLARTFRVAGRHLPALARLQAPLLAPAALLPLAPWLPRAVAWALAAALASVGFALGALAVAALREGEAPTWRALRPRLLARLGNVLATGLAAAALVALALAGAGWLVARAAAALAPAGGARGLALALGAPLLWLALALGTFALLAVCAGALERRSVAGNLRRALALVRARGAATWGDLLVLALLLAVPVGATAVMLPLAQGTWAPLAAALAVGAQAALYAPVLTAYATLAHEAAAPRRAPAVPAAARWDAIHTW